MTKLEAALLLFMLAAIGALIALWFRVEDLQHQIRRHEAQIQSHEDILVPKHLQ